MKPVNRKVHSSNPEAGRGNYLTNVTNLHLGTLHTTTQARPLKPRVQTATLLYPNKQMRASRRTSSLNTLATSKFIPQF